MKRLYGLAATFLLALLIVASCSQPDTIVRRDIVFDQTQAGIVQVMTFNIRNGAADDGENDWSHRKELVFDILAYHAPDVIGLQEVFDFQMHQIRRALPQYAAIFVGRDDGDRAGEGCPILFCRDRFTLADSGTFWFSNSPWRPGTMHWGNRYPRICTWARLTETATDRSFYVYNLHLDHISQTSREYSIDLLQKELAQRKSAAPAIVMGDFNMDTDNPAMAPLWRIGADLRNDPMTDVWSCLHPDQPSVTTAQAFGKRPDGPCVDHILIDRSFEIIEAAVDTRSFDGRYPSDHFPVIATVKLKY